MRRATYYAWGLCRTHQTRKRLSEQGARAWSHDLPGDGGWQSGLHPRYAMADTRRRHVGFRLQRREHRVRVFFAPYHFAFVTNNSTEFWNVAAEGVHKAEKDFGIKVEIFRPLRGQISEQQRYLENILALKLDGLAVNPVSSDAMTPVLNRLAEAMPVICHDSDAPHSRRRSYVGSNNVEAGRAAGVLALGALGEKRSGKVGLFVGRSDMQNAVQRLQGLTETLKGKGLELLPLFWTTPIDR